MSDAFGYQVPGDDDTTDTPENNVTMIDVPVIQTGPPPVDEEGEPITPPEPDAEPEPQPEAEPEADDE